MKTFNTATARRVGLAIAFLGGSILAAPAMAACNPNARAQSEAQTLPELTNGLPTTVHLDGTGSTPKNGGLAFSWTYLGSTPSGYAVTLVNRTTATPTFAAPDVASAGANLSFRLTVTCEGNTSTATTSINITDVVSNFPPTAVGTVSPASIHEGDLVTLDGSASYDLNNTPQTSGLTYQWKQVDGTGNPVIGGVTLLGNATGSIATFIAPNMANSTAGSTLRFRLTVSDGTLSNSTDKLVTVLWLNDPPIARLACPGGVIDVNEGALVTLDGSGSSDGDDGIKSFQWSQENGPPNIPVASLTTSIIEFNAPSLGYQQIGSLPFTLTVTDNTGDSSQAACSVFIHDVTPPLISAPGDLAVEASNAQGASPTYSVSAFDAVDDLVPYPLACTPPSGSVFALGTTTVQCATADSAGNPATVSFKITVADHTAPVLQPHADIGLQATSAAGAIADFDLPAVSDAVDASPLVTCIPPPGSQFALGTTSVSCSASDMAGNSATPIGFNVDVFDTIAPAVTPPADVTAEATGPLTVVAHGTATASDAVGVSSQSDDAPASFPVGVTTIHWTARDAVGNTGSATSRVTVTDHTPPTIDAPDLVADIEATSPDGAVVTYASPASHDLVDGPGLANCTPASGTTFALGTTSVTCTATDAHGNAATAVHLDVNVVDTTAPIIDAQIPIADVEATGAAGATIDYPAPATHDAVDGVGSATCTPPSGNTYALGPHTFNCNATDAHHNKADAIEFVVHVVDTTPPTIDAHDDIGHVEATDSHGAQVTYASPSTHDIVDGDGSATCELSSGSVFPIGTTTVHCNAKDHAGNDAPTTSFTVEVVDTIPPVIASHDDVGPIEATSAAGAVVSYALPATSDAVDGPGLASCSPLSGSQFALGSTDVACAAIDHAGNHATTTFFKVTVRDSTAPAIATHADISVEATGPLGAVVSYAAPLTSDAVDGAGSAACLPATGSTFAVGVHTVTCTAHDAAGNVSTPTTFRIAVVDTTAPVIAAHADVNVNATGNSTALVTYVLPTATDLVDGVVQATCAPTSGTSFNVGSTTVTCSATDHAGNHAASSFKMVVSYAFNGFYRPVDNLPTLNVVKAGSAIPVKFDLGGNQGLNIFASGYPASVATTCNAAATDAIEETVTAGGSSLSFDAASGQYIYVWKTEKSWAGSCRQLQVKLRDGSSRWAAFNFSR